MSFLQSASTPSVKRTKRKKMQAAFCTSRPSPLQWKDATVTGPALPRIELGGLPAEGPPRFLPLKPLLPLLLKARRPLPSSLQTPASLLVQPHLPLCSVSLSDNFHPEREGEAGAGARQRPRDPRASGPSAKPDDPGGFAGRPRGVRDGSAGTSRWKPLRGPAPAASETMCRAAAGGGGWQGGVLAVWKQDPCQGAPSNRECNGGRGPTRALRGLLTLPLPKRAARPSGRGCRPQCLPRPPSDTEGCPSILQPCPPCAPQKWPRPSSRPGRAINAPFWVANGFSPPHPPRLLCSPRRPAPGLGASCQWEGADPPRPSPGYSCLGGLTSNAAGRAGRRHRPRPPAQSACSHRPPSPPRGQRAGSPGRLPVGGAVLRDHLLIRGQQLQAVGAEAHASHAAGDGDAASRTSREGGPRRRRRETGRLPASETLQQ